MKIKAKIGVRKKREQKTGVLMRNCWPPISNLSLCGCKLLLVVLEKAVNNINLLRLIKIIW